MLHSHSIAGSPQSRAARVGFTLVEMIVAIGLLMLIMVLFAQIMGLASGIVTKHRGIVTLDQKARIAFTLLDGDLKRTSLRPNPGANGLEALVRSSDLLDDGQQGYLYISENDPDDQTDDVLQFTVSGIATETYDGFDTNEYFGKAQSFDPNPARRNHPDWDDARFIPPPGTGDNSSVSSSAEIAYFLRRGVLYRRVMLIRDATLTPADEQDKLPSPNAHQPAFFDTAGAPPAVVEYTQAFDVQLRSNSFYDDFDYSAYYFDGAEDEGAPPATRVPRVRFMGSLTNKGGTELPQLGNPRYRFGFFSQDDAVAALGAAADALDGQPMEFATLSGGEIVFFGRFTHEETSHASFNFPHRPTAAQFYTSAALVNGHDTTVFLDRGVLDGFADGPRRGADILLTNVLAFDVEAWDDNAGAFVDIGRTTAATGKSLPISFTSANNLNAGYGGNPSSTANHNIFDTWHPSATTPAPKGSAHRAPPYSFRSLPPSGTTYDLSTARSAPPVVREWDATFPKTFTTFAGANFEIFPSAANTATGGLEESIIYQVISVDDPGVPNSPPETSVDIDTAVEPNWPLEVGGIVEIVDTTDGDTVRLRAVSNMRALNAIRITIHFRDVGSDTVRQETIVHYFGRAAGVGG